MQLAVGEIPHNQIDLHYSHSLPLRKLMAPVHVVGNTITLRTLRVHASRILVEPAD
jgi:hypothetical protein